MSPKEIAFNEAVEGMKVSKTPDPEQIKEIILLFLDYLEELIHSERIDETLEKIEGFIRDDRFGLFRAVLNAFRLRVQANKV